MELKIKKIDKKIELDTKVEACWNNCHVGYYSGYDASINASTGGRSCRVAVKRTPRGSIFC